MKISKPILDCLLSCLNCNRDLREYTVGLLSNQKFLSQTLLYENVLFELIHTLLNSQDTILMFLRYNKLSMINLSRELSNFNHCQPWFSMSNNVPTESPTLIRGSYFYPLPLYHDDCFGFQVSPCSSSSCLDRLRVGFMRRPNSSIKEISGICWNQADGSIFGGCEFKTKVGPGESISCFKIGGKVRFQTSVSHYMDVDLVKNPETDYLNEPVYACIVCFVAVKIEIIDSQEISQQQQLPLRHLMENNLQIDVTGYENPMAVARPSLSREINAPKTSSPFGFCHNNIPSSINLNSGLISLHKGKVLDHQIPLVRMVPEGQHHLDMKIIQTRGYYNLKDIRMNLVKSRGCSLYDQEKDHPIDSVAKDSFLRVLYEGDILSVLLCRFPLLYQQQFGAEGRDQSKITCCVVLSQLLDTYDCSRSFLSIPQTADIIRPLIKVLITSFCLPFSRSIECSSASSFWTSAFAIHKAFVALLNSNDDDQQFEKMLFTDRQISFNLHCIQQLSAFYQGQYDPICTLHRLSNFHKKVAASIVFLFLSLMLDYHKAKALQILTAIEPSFSTIISVFWTSHMFRNDDSTEPPLKEGEHQLINFTSFFTVEDTAFADFCLKLLSFKQIGFSLADGREIDLQAEFLSWSERIRSKKPSLPEGFSLPSNLFVN